MTTKDVKINHNGLNLLVEVRYGKYYWEWDFADIVTLCDIDFNERFNLTDEQIEKLDMKKNDEHIDYQILAELKDQLDREKDATLSEVDRDD